MCNGWPHWQTGTPWSRWRAPRHAPVLVFRRSEDVVVLSLDAVDRPIGLVDADAIVRGGRIPAYVFVRPEFLVALVDQRTARGIAVHHDFKGVVVEIGTGKIPVRLVGLVEEIEPVQPLHPADFH